jgi:hypothetical protein
LNNGRKKAALALGIAMIGNVRMSIRFFNDWEMCAVWKDTKAKWYFSVMVIVGIFNEEADDNKVRN